MLNESHNYQENTHDFRIKFLKKKKQSTQIRRMSSASLTKFGRLVEAVAQGVAVVT